MSWVAVASQLLVYTLVVRLFHIPLTSNVEDVKGPDVTVVYQIVTVLVAVIAAPFVEELVFRGVIMRGFLSRMGPVVAITLQGLLFGFAHSDPSRGAGNIGLALVLSAVGITLGTSAYLTRRIGPTVCAHAIFNGVVMAILLSGILDDADKELGHLAGLLSALPF